MHKFYEYNFFIIVVILDYSLKYSRDNGQIGLGMCKRCIIHDRNYGRSKIHQLRRGQKIVIGGTISFQYKKNKNNIIFLGSIWYFSRFLAQSCISCHSVST